jgi:Flp pilus assembly protein TadD
MVDPNRMREAVALHTAGKLNEAWNHYTRLAADDPADPDLKHLMGVLAGQVGNLLESVRLISEALQARPKAAEYHKNLAVTLQRLERNPQAAAEFLVMADLLVEEKRFDEAIDAYRLAIQLDPKNLNIVNNLGATLNRLGRHAEAKEWLGRSLAPDPGMPPALMHWNGTVGPEGYLRQSTSLHLNYGNALGGLGDHEGAIRFFNNAVTLKPDSVEAHGNLALTYLLAGRYEEGWREFEWRWQKEDYKRANFNGPMWKGESAEELGGKLLVLSEQGYGDTIQFARFLPILAARGHDILFEVKAELMTLFSEGLSHDRIELVPARAAGPDAYDDLGYAAFTGMISIPGILGTTVDTIPTAHYLDVSRKRLDHWKKRIADDKSSLKVGIVWGGNPNHPRNAERSIPAPLLHPLLEREDVTFYSLQKGPAARWPFPYENVVVLDAELPDFADTAAAMKSLDLVIGADTGATHLAAALGCPTWVLVTKVPDWRWLLEREDSPWYPSVRLFRQAEAGNWPEVIGRVGEALDRLAST